MVLMQVLNRSNIDKNQKNEVIRILYKQIFLCNIFRCCICFVDVYLIILDVFLVTMCISDHIRRISSNDIPKRPFINQYRDSVFSFIFLNPNPNNSYRSNVVMRHSFYSLL